MYRITQRVVMLFTLLTLPPAVLADTVYYIQNYRDLQNTYSLSGAITTDGTTGAILPQDIKSWSWTITNAGYSFTANSSDPVPAVQLAGLVATPTELLLPFPTNFTDVNSLSFTALSFTANVISQSDLAWTTSLNSVLGPAVATEALPSTAFIAWADTGYPPESFSSPGGRAGWVIATAPTAVPEPATLYLLGFGTICGVLFVMRHRRREQRYRVAA